MLKRDLLELCLLQLLTAEDRYGYDLLRRLSAVFPDTQESTIYAILRGLCKEGCTETYQGETSGGPTRKYYRLTKKGKKLLDSKREEWELFRQGVDGVLSGGASALA